MSPLCRGCHALNAQPCRHFVVDFHRLCRHIVVIETPTGDKQMTKTPKTAPRTIQEINSSETKDDRYAIYVSCATDLGWKIKTYEEWLRS